MLSVPFASDEMYTACFRFVVVDNLITKIESYFGNMETVADSTTSQVKPEVQGILLESSTRAQLGECRTEAT